MLCSDYSQSKKLMEVRFYAMIDELNWCALYGCEKDLFGIAEAMGVVHPVLFHLACVFQPGKRSLVPGWYMGCLGRALMLSLRNPRTGHGRNFRTRTDWE